MFSHLDSDSDGLRRALTSALKQTNNTTPVVLLILSWVLAASSQGASGPRPAASIGATSNLAEMQIPRPQPRPTDSEMLTVGPGDLCFQTSSHVCLALANA